uniref:Uncharacterized protein n=1 Tax=Globodera pallida TaxID=36090 RepID=A0A183CHE3_GLOPA
MKLQPNLRKTEFAWEKPVSEQCKQKVENCSCGHASCIFTGVQKHDIIDICCEEQYEFKCCPDATLLTTVPPAMKKVEELKGTCTDKAVIKRICKTCDFYKCIRHEGFAASVCCAENYEFRVA